MCHSAVEVCGCPVRVCNNGLEHDCQLLPGLHYMDLADCHVGDLCLCSLAAIRATPTLSDMDAPVRQPSHDV